MISVIVPVYNVEEYLKECLDSLIAQTYKDFEVIMVNDGSTDSSCDICKSYLEDKRFTLIDVQNGGVSRARNMALSRMKGEYFCFLDSDDTYDVCYLEKMINAIKVNNADISVSGWQSFTRHPKPNDNVYSSSILISEYELYKGIFITNDIGGFVWNKLFKKDLWQEEYFDEKLSICEDTHFLLRILKRAKKICKVNEELYNYRARDCSATRNIEKTFLGNVSKYVIAYDSMISSNLIKEEYINIAKTSICLICINQKCDYKNSVKGVKRKIIRELNKVINSNFKYLFKSKEISFKRKIRFLLYHLFNLKKWI